jgi:hypothetical protein
MEPLFKKPATDSGPPRVAIQRDDQYVPRGQPHTGFSKEIGKRASTNSIIPHSNISSARTDRRNASSISSGSFFEQDTWTCKEHNTTVLLGHHRGEESALYSAMSLSTNGMKKGKREAKEKQKGKRSKKTPTTTSGVIAGIPCGRKELHRRKNSANGKHAEGVSHQSW